MKSTLISRIGIVALMMSISALASANSGVYEDVGTTRSVTPNIENVNQPQQVCEQVEVPSYQNNGYQGNSGRSYTGSVIGGIAGALLGNTVGRGNGRTAAAAVGAVTGAIAGDRLDNQNTGYQNGNQNNGSQTQQRCRWVDSYTTRQNGYLVAYEYAGHSYTTVMPYDPGKKIRVMVSVTAR